MRPPPDEVLLRRNGPRHPEVLWRDRAVRLLADDRVALLGTEDVHRFGAVGRDAEWLAGGHDRLPQRETVGGRDVELERELPGERDTEHAPGRAPDDRLAPGHERERVVRDIEVGRERRHDLARRAARRRPRSPIAPSRSSRGPAVRATRSGATPQGGRGRPRRCRSWSSCGTARRRSAKSPRRRRPSRRRGTSRRTGTSRP